MEVIIPKSTAVPCVGTKHFPTIGNNQTKVVLEVLQGEATRADACHLVTKRIVEGIPKGPAGSHGVDVTFTIGVDGTLDINIVGSSGLAQE